MGQEVKIICDSMSPDGVRLTTFQLKYERFFHSELMTHRVFSRNFSSSRAVPVKVMLEQISSEPAMPHFWGKNQAGMQANNELSADEILVAKNLWLDAAKKATELAGAMMDCGLHKQVANRILEPFSYIHGVVSATDFDGFFALRNHPDAQPEIRDLAKEMQRQYDLKESLVYLDYNEWHLPYVLPEEKNLPIEIQIKISVARCCRVSYIKHGSAVVDIQNDIDLYDRLVSADPPHLSPVEHQARCLNGDTSYSANFRQWVQHRKEIE